MHKELIYALMAQHCSLLCNVMSDQGGKLYRMHCKGLASLQGSGRCWHGCMQVHSHNHLHSNTASWEPQYPLRNTRQSGKIHDTC